MIFTFKLAFKKLLSNKVIFILLIAGLSLSMLCALLIGLYVKHELSFDKFHVNNENIFRLLQVSDNKYKTCIFSANLLTDIKPHLPEIEKATRVESDEDVFIKINNDYYNVEKLIYAEPDFFDIFSFKTITGDYNQLSEPLTAFVSKKFADKYFRNESPVGKTFIFEYEYTFTIVGLYEDFPSNSHLQTDVIVSFESLKITNNYAFQYWYRYGTNIYFFLTEECKY